jgi:hypothetical protein
VRLARRADPLKKGENAEMAKFEAFVKELVPDDPAMKLFAAGVTTKQPGEPLHELLRRTGGVYEMRSVLGPRMRESVRQVAELTGDARPKYTAVAC